MGWLKLAWEIIKAGSKYGSKFAKWVWANKVTILKWSNAGYTVGQIVYMIAQILGMA
ncbi:aureocin A53 family class IId bacteriocin [Streptomyces sp. 5.8]|uniref:aureocin A53 family class IId bacteriocin n=1 Tax=Streptomyces sp. 5.8 TaxID=3406571 RepID=UPI003BB68ED1